ncbi:MAG: hypothetical protein IPL55_02465 [Saprospiraceae bacterium]|nr:hypothetical protein [Saprospiraceae bacterium]
MNFPIKLVIALLFVYLFGIKSFGQNKYGNEWIEPSKTYYKIKVAENGIYKVTYEELVSVGFNKGQVFGSALKLINFGQEQSIYVSGNTFGPGSWFEFYGQKNTIGLDTFLYSDWKKDLLNPDYSLVNDTNTYFLTLSPETSNLRHTLVNPDYNNITLTPFPYYLHEEKVVYSSTFFKNVDGDIRYSHFEPSEGFASGVLQVSNTELKMSGYVEAGPLPILSFRTGQNNQVSRLEISWNNKVIETRLLNPKLTTQHSYTLDKTEIKATNTLTLRNVNTALDRHIIANATLKYPRSFDFGNKATVEFQLNSSTPSRLLEISSFKSDNQSVFLYDINNKIRYSTKVNAGKVLAIVNGTLSEAKYILCNTGEGFKKVASISTFIPRTFVNKGQQFVFISNKSLNAFGPDNTQEYANYRSSIAGGGYKTEIIDIQDIYDHFGYGIDRHFMGVKQFAGYMNKNWPDVKFVLLMGKGIEYPYMRTTNDVVNNVDRVFYIPTFGYVGSDNMLFSEGNFPDPYFALGRIAARTGDDIRNYLDKVRQYDQAPFAPQTVEDKYWMKRVLNLGGGKNEFEQNAIKSGLENMASLLTDTIYGADVRAYYKRSSDAIQFNVNEEINHLFENGVSIINFFGHSAAGSWDFSIENPRNYNNFGRYAFINSFGCYSGNLHGTAKGISESFVLEKDRGSIGFLASTGTAFISSLSFYGYRFYTALLKDLRYKSYGEAIKSIATQNRTAQYADLALYAQLTYHGDPSIRPYIERGPDYLFEGKNVKTNPTTIQAALNTFKIDIDIANIGTFSKDSFDLVFYHELPNGKIVDTIYIRKEGIPNLANIELSLKNYGNASVGKNRLLGTIDPKNTIKELPNPEGENNNELYTNNQKGFEFFVTDNYATAIYPPDYAMINTKDHFVLKASTSSVPVKKGNYIFQIDTTAYFNSPIKETGKVESEGGLITYQPKLALVADRVYYWRVSPDSTISEGYKWSLASFAFLPNEDEGWNQSHFFQFQQNEFTDLELSEETGRKFEFGKEYSTIKLRNKLWDPDDRPGFTFSNVRFSSVTPWDYMDEGIGFVICDRNEFIAGIFNPAGGLYGSYNPTGGQSRGFFFRTTTLNDRKNIIEFIETELKDHYYINVFTILKNTNSKLNANEWANDSLSLGKNLFSVLENLGATQIRKLINNSVPYVFQAEKGKGAINEEIGLTISDIVEGNMTVSRNLTKGETSSIKIGPVKSWKSIKYQKSDPITGSTLLLDINSFKTNNDKIPIETEINKPGSSINLSNISESFIQITSKATDTINRNSPQLLYWRTSFTPFPDAAISFLKSEPNFSSNEIKQGEKVKIFYDVANVNFVAMDSILVKYTYIGSDNQATANYKKLGKLLSGQKISDMIEFNIGAGNITDVRLIIEINPDNNQPELNLFNNTLTVQFGVKRDQTNPLLDILFDGIHIMDGDIVSPKPEILITLEDDNTLLPVTDPNLFEMKLDTGRNQIMEIPMTSPQIKFTPAGNGNTTAKIQYYPNLKEGDYKLIVQAKDASGNKSGVNPRSVNFKVIERQSISNVLNYPNPFSTSTQFVFTLTGEEVPEIMSISIMTVSGKVVREITKEELGPLHIGLNRSEYKWDGTDDYGSKLANGVYLYKVNTRKKDKSLYDQFSLEKTDSYFTKGFGKLVILR